VGHGQTKAGRESSEPLTNCRSEDQCGASILIPCPTFMRHGFHPAPPAAALAGCLAQPVRSLWTLAGATHLPRLPCTLGSAQAPLPQLCPAAAGSGQPLRQLPQATTPTQALHRRAGLCLPWQNLITRYKFQADLGLVRSLGRLMASHPEVREQLRACDALLPMPASAQRVRERGFDHSLLLARSSRSNTTGLCPC
jgi:hypothetical protein